jgi:hypothetical protein
MRKTISIVMVGTLVIVALMTAGAARTPGSASASSSQSGSYDKWKSQAQTMVAMIDCTLRGEQSYGAGIIFNVDNASDRLYIVTARHVVFKGDTPAQNISVRFNWRTEKVTAYLTAHNDPDLDVAVLYVKGLNKLGGEVASLPFSCLGKPGDSSLESKVYFIGYGGNQGWHTSVGRMEGEDEKYLEFEASSLRRGHSGGALTDEKWRLIGMNLLEISPGGQALRIDQIITRLQGWQYSVSLKDRPREPTIDAISGVWHGKATGNGSTWDLVLNIKVISGKVTGTINTNAGPITITSGKWSGNSLELVGETWDRRTVTFNATLEDGKLFGDFDASPRSKGTWEASKTK